MKQNTFIVSLINLKEQLHTFYQKRNRIVGPIVKGLLMLVILLTLNELFPYGVLGGRKWILGVVSLLQAFIPASFIFYISSAFILANLYKLSIDICIGFMVFLVICIICYFRIDNRYSYLAVVVPVLFYYKIGLAAPAVLALAVGLEALIPVASGIMIYYFAMTLQETYTLLTAEEGSRIGVGLMNTMTSMMKNQTFLIILAASCVAVIATAILHKLFYENAWLVSIFTGNAVMAAGIIVGTMYFKVNIPLWLILTEMVVGIILCFGVEMLRGIGDVTRIEKTVFEDDEYIYYVKAVPKIRVTQSEPSVKIMNEAILEESIEEESAGQVEEKPVAQEEDLKEEILEEEISDGAIVEEMMMVAAQEEELLEEENDMETGE